MTSTSHHSHRIDSALRSATISATIVVGACAAALSYSGLHSLATSAGIHPILAALLPVCVDGLIFVGAMTTLAATLSESSTRFGWSLTVIGVLVSVYGNAASVSDGVGWELWQSRIIHAIAPISLALCVEGLMLVTRQRAVELVEADIKQAKAEAAAIRRAAATANGGKRRGKKPAKAEVTDALIAEARTMRAAGDSFRQIAAAFPQRSTAGWHRILTESTPS